MYYLKLHDVKLYLYEDDEGGLDQRKENKIGVSVKNNNIPFETIKDLFSTIEDITIYGCIEQEDGTETDEYIANFFEGYSEVYNISYNVMYDYYKVFLAKPDEVNERFNGLEDAVNFLLMGGE